MSSESWLSDGQVPSLPIANLIFTLILFAITWWIFQDPRGVMRFYTPYVGYNYCRWWLIILIWMAYIFDFWPFKRKWLETAHPLQKGLVLALISVAIMIMMIHGFFQSVLGNTAFAYFNPQQLLKLKGLTEFYATGVCSSGLHDVRRDRFLDLSGMGRRS